MKTKARYIDSYFDTKVQNIIECYSFLMPEYINGYCSCFIRTSNYFYRIKKEFYNSTE